MAAPRLRILGLDLFERDVVLRLPFRFGVVTLTACPQAFVRARIAVEDGVEAVGASAELLAPKWFDKNLALTNEDNFRQLRDSLRLAREAYLADTRSRCAFRHAASCYQALIDSGSLRGLNPLVVGFGHAVIDRLTTYRITLDGNEQFADAEAAVRFWRQLEGTPALRRMADATLYIEQPLPRAITLETDIAALASAKPVLIDEADGTLDAFPAAAARGYTGVSSKNCKGFYKSLLNAARCARRNCEGGPRFFMSGEDLTTQAGLAVQQDLALVNLLGLRHVERNGHHYVHGFAGQGASRDEQRGFAEAHPDLYEGDADDVRLRLRDGRLHLKSLDQPGFATGAHPDFTTMTPIP